MFRGEQKKIKKRKKTQKSTLSFALDDEEDEQESSANGTNSNSPAPGSGLDDGKPAKKAKLGKNPAVDTSFLPDREREEAERKEREDLRQEWLKKQEELKDEDIEVTYSYWDGSGHRKSVMVCAVTAWTAQLLTCMVFSVRRAIRSHTFWKSAASSSLNFEVSAWITSCISRFFLSFSSTSPPVLTFLVGPGGPHHSTSTCGDFHSSAKADPSLPALHILQLYRQ